jgi:hypothetical protein
MRVLLQNPTLFFMENKFCISRSFVGFVVHLYSDILVTFQWISKRLYQLIVACKPISTDQHFTNVLNRFNWYE